MRICVARLHAVGAPQQIPGGEALHHHRGALFEGQASGSFTSSGGGDVAALGNSPDGPPA